MQPKTVVFFGISGAGKGTQIHLLRKYLEEKDSARHALHFDMGVGLREMAQTPTMLAVKVKKIMAEGGLVPSFVCSYVLTDFLSKYFRSDDHLLIDGTPRRVAQASALDAELAFYDRPDYEIVSFDISEDSARKRMEGRKRMDDTSEAIQGRINFFNEHVVPALELLKSRGRIVHHVNAEGTAEEVNQEVLKVLNLV